MKRQLASVNGPIGQIAKVGKECEERDPLTKVCVPHTASTLRLNPRRSTRSNATFVRARRCKARSSKPFGHRS